MTCQCFFVLTLSISCNAISFFFSLIALPNVSQTLYHSLQNTMIFNKVLKMSGYTTICIGIAKNPVAYMTTNITNRIFIIYVIIRVLLSFIKLANFVDSKYGLHLYSYLEKGATYFHLFVKFVVPYCPKKHSF